MTVLASPPAASADVAAAVAERDDLLAAVHGLTVADRMLAAATEHADDPALTWYDGDAAVQLSWAEYRQRALEVSAAFVSLGVAPGETVAMMLGNRAEHLLADLGAMHAGAVSLTVYATLAPAQVGYIAGDADVRVAVLEGADQLARFSEALAGDGIRHVVVVDESAVSRDDPRFVAWADFVARGREALAQDPGAVDARWRSLGQDDDLTLLYTSGTTGNPKGVRLTHRNVLFEAEGLRRLTAFETPPVSVSYLPLAHVAERNLSLYIPIHMAGSVHLCPDINGLAGVLVKAQPTSFFAVPRVWEKLQSGLSALLSLEPDEQKRAAREAAFATGRRWVYARENGGTPDAGLAADFERADREVLAPLRAAIGLGRTEWYSSGAAPLAPAVAEFLAGLGIVLCEVFGMTETCGAATANRREAFKLNTVGRAMPGCEVALADDGEVLIRGPITTPGYLGLPEQTAELLGADGWLHTGDIGEVDADGYLRIVDRKKELIITAGGENISPAAVEGVLKEDALIGQAMAVGDRQRYLCALLVLDGEALPGWLASRGLPAMDVGAAAGDADVLAAVGAAVATANQRLARVQQVKAWRLLPREWTAESGELTPTLKLRRRVILERYADEIVALYG